MGYSYKIAKEVLNENDKNRLMCLYLNCNPSAIDWAKAAAEFGCASVESMKVMTRTAMKKIENAGGKVDDDGNVATPTPKKAGGGGRKRKPAMRQMDGDDEEDVGTPTPAKKMKGGKGKKGKSVTPDDGAGSGDGIKVKAENVEDEEDD